MAAFFMEPWQPRIWPVLPRLQGSETESDGSSLSEIHTFDYEDTHRIVNALHNLVWHESVVNGQRKRVH